MSSTPDRPRRHPVPTAMTPTLNRYGKVTFCSDRPDLAGRHVQVVYRAYNRSVELWSPRQELLYTMSSASLDYETEQREIKFTPTWAVVLAVIGAFFFLLGLLFLLVKETKHVPVTSARFTDGYGRALVLNVG